MTDATPTPAVWLGCLACYNSGELVGAWMAPDEAADMTPAELHKMSGGRVPADVATHEELWVMDQEHTPLSGEFGPLECREIADAFEAVGEDEWPAFLAYASTGVSADRIPDVEEFREAYAGEWRSREEFAQDLAEDIGAVPAEYSWPASYIDWERATRDLFMDYSSEDAPGGGVYVFRSL